MCPVDDPHAAALDLAHHLVAADARQRHSRHIDGRQIMRRRVPGRGRRGARIGRIGTFGHAANPKRGAEDNQPSLYSTLAASTKRIHTLRSPKYSTTMLE